MAQAGTELGLGPNPWLTVCSSVIYYEKEMLKNVISI